MQLYGTRVIFRIKQTTAIRHHDFDNAAHGNDAAAYMAGLRSNVDYLKAMPIVDGIAEIAGVWEQHTD